MFYIINRKKAYALTSLKVQFLGRDVNGSSPFDILAIQYEEDLAKAKFENSNYPKILGFMLKLD